MPDERDEAEAVRGDYMAAVQRVRSDRQLNALGRYQQLERLFIDARQKMAGLRAAFQSRMSGEQRELVRQLMEFRPPRFSEPQQRLAIAAGYRDALDRIQAVAQHHGPRGVLEQLQRADRIGDAQLARAAFAITVEHRIGDPLRSKGWDEVLDAYLTLYPSDDDFEAVAVLRRTTAKGKTEGIFERGAIFSIAEPSELKSRRPAPTP